MRLKASKFAYINTMKIVYINLGMGKKHNI